MSITEANCTDPSKSIPDNETDWWENFVSEDYPNEKCVQYFKCSRKNYMFLVEFLRPYVAPKIGSSPDISIYLCKGIGVEKQIAILLYKLSTAAEYKSITKRFEVHKTTIHKIIYKCIAAINKHLLPKIISMPQRSEAESVAQDFENIYQLPQIIGVMNLVHIPISSPIHLNHQFLNSKLYPSFILQCIIDSNYYFRDISIRHAGAAEPHQILEDSHINKYWKKVFPNEKAVVNGVYTPYKIVGSGPLNSWLLNDYDPPSSPKEIIFNKRLEKIRKFGDSVIMRLRSRFLILSKMIEINYKVVPQIIAACCVIHNICEKENDPFFEDWITVCKQNSKIYPQPEMEAEWEKPDDKILMERDILKDSIAVEETD